jgi:hypothetical protein
MGFYLQVDEEMPAMVASLLGWGDVMKWSDGLSHRSGVTIQHLCAFGWQDNVVALKIQLGECLKVSPPDDRQTRDTVENLLSVLSAHHGPITVVSITDGLGANNR